MRFLAVVLGLMLPFMAYAEDAAKYKEGQHYTIIEGAPKPGKTGKIEVTEFFWYGCGHCYNFEPLIQKWKSGIASDVTFTATPAVWRDPMVPHAKMYYTARSLKLLDKLHPVFFNYLNRAPGGAARALQTSDQIANLVKQHDVDADAFVATMESFAVNSQLQQGLARQKAASITGTPEMVVAGYYLVSSSKAGSHQAMLDVVDFLVEKIRKERG